MRWTSLLPVCLVQHDGPSTITVQLLDQPQNGRICAHILSYIPVRKSATIDIVEERTAVHNLTFQFDLPGGFTKDRLVPENTALQVSDGIVTVPSVNGYAIIELS